MSRVVFTEGAAAATPDTGKVALYAKADGLLYSKDDLGVEVTLSNPSGTVIGPVSSTDNALVRWDGTTGALVQDSNATLSDVGALVVASTIAASNFSGTHSGTSSNTNSGDVSLAAVGSSPNANAASLSGQVLNLQPADGSFPGAVSTTTQSFAGRKTFIGGATMSAALYESVVALTDAATIATDASLGNIFTVTLGGNRTLGAPTNPVNGQKCIWRVRQDGTGSRTLAFNAAFRFGTSVASVVLTTSANKTDYIGAIYNSTDSTWDVVAFADSY